MCGPSDVDYISSKVCEMRIFADETGRMNRSVGDAGGSVLVVSQFTLMGDLRKGRRASFDAAEPPASARTQFDAVVEGLRRRGVPVTMLLDSRRLV